MRETESKYYKISQHRKHLSPRLLSRRRLTSIDSVRIDHGMFFSVTEISGCLVGEEGRG